MTNFEWFAATFGGFAIAALILASILYLMFRKG